MAIFLLRLAAVIPISCSVMAGVWMGWLLLLCNQKRRHIVETNLRHCYPELSDKERDSLMRNHYRVYGQSIIGLGLLWWGSQSRCEHLYRIEGLQWIDNVRTAKRRILLLCPHNVATDYGGVLISQHFPLLVMFNPFKNTVINHFFCLGRQRYGIELLKRKEGMLKMVRNFKELGACYLAADGDYGIDNAIFAPFYSIKKATLTTPSRLAKLCDASILLCTTAINPKTGQIVATIHPPIAGLPSSDSRQDMILLNQKMESLIRDDPAQFMWSMKWFKTRPEGAESIYEV